MKIKYALAIIVAVALTAGYLLFNVDPSGEDAEIHQAISSEDVEEVRMSIVVYEEPRFEHVEVELSKQEVDHILTLFNSVPEDRIREVQAVNPALHAGIVVEVKSNSEIRMQYDKAEIFVTRTDRKGQVRYVMDDPELKAVFDRKLG